MQESESDVDDVTIRMRPQRRFRNKPLCLRSPYWTQNAGFIRTTTPREKIISNYAFLSVSTEHPEEYV
jgi:hypothetical protein